MPDAGCPDLDSCSDVSTWYHRPGVADGMDKPWPGSMGRAESRKAGRAMKNYCSPAILRARIYVDETGANACNEVAIGWNAPGWSRWQQTYRE